MSTNLIIVLIIVSIIFVIHYVLHSILIYNIYEKISYKKVYAFIPIINYYRYFNFMNLPYILVFIPGINIITIWLSLYVLSKKLKNNTIISIISMFIPVLLIKNIKDARFGNIQNTSIDDSFNNLFDVYRTTKEIDELEERLENNNNEDINDLDQNINANNSNNEDSISGIDNMIDIIESNAKQDDIDEELLRIESNNEDKKDVVIQNNEEIEIIDNNEIQDLFSNNDIRSEKNDMIDSKIEESASRKIIDNSDYKEYQGKETDISTIAFGGINQDEKIEKNRLAISDTSNVCPYCHNVLNEVTNICPSCGKSLE